MPCPSCGDLVPGGARFCPSCGAEVAPVGDERRVVTVLFADIVGFTSLSETLDPERVKLLIDGWFERLVADIGAFGGRVDKIVGDAILALFGAPIAHEDDAERAVRAALRMQETIATMAAEAEAGRGAAVRMRIGVNTGEVLVGALRSGGPTTAMGDVVNTASRLQTAAQPGEVMVGPTTHAATRHAVGYDRRGRLSARGRESPVETWVAVGAVLPPGRRPDRPRAPLVGRARELGLLESAATTALGHDRALVALVVGDAGVGKSRVVQEAAERIACESGAVVLDGRCVPYGEANVWWPVAEAIRSGVGIDPTDPEPVARAAVVKVVSEAFDRRANDPEVERVSAGLLGLLGHGPNPARSDLGGLRDEAVRSVVGLAEASARRQPVVLLLSDLHWADRAVLDLLERLLERLARLPFVILATARQTIRERWTVPAGRHDVLSLNLDPLDREASESLLVALLGSEATPEVRDLLLARSEGNPFFLEELVALVDTDRPEIVGAVDLPDTLRGIVTARLDALDPAERAVVTDASVLGRQGPVVALRHMASGLGRSDEIDDALEGLVQRELLVRDGDWWAFRSEIAREVAYATLPKAERARRHAGIAKWIEADEFGEHHLTLEEVDSGAARVDDRDDLDDATVDRIAHHYAAAAELVADLGPVDRLPHALHDRAVAWLTVAARRAMRHDLRMAAEGSYTRAIDLTASDDDDRVLRLRLARSAVRSDGWDVRGARDDAEAVLRGAQRIGDGRLETGALLRLGDLEQKSGDGDAAVARLRNVAERFAAEGDEGGRGEALRLLGMTLMFAGRTSEAADAVTKARLAFAAEGDRSGQAWTAQNLAWIAMVTGDLAAAEQSVGSSLQIFSDVGDPVGLAWALGLLAFIRFQQGHLAEAETLAIGVRAEAEARGDRWPQAMMQMLEASLSLWRGEALSAAERSLAAVTTLRDLGDPWGLSMALATRGRALVLSGHTEEGFSALAEAVRSAQRTSTENWGLAQWAAVGTCAQVGDPGRVPELVGRGPEAADATRMLLAGTRPDEAATIVALLALQDGRLVDADATLGVVDPDDGEERAFALCLSALVRAAQGDVAEATRAADAAARRREATYQDRILADLAVALVAARAGSHEVAATRLDAACRSADSTEDRVAQTLVRLAVAVAAEATDQPGADLRRGEVEIRMRGLGLDLSGWEVALALAAGGRAAEPQHA